MKEKISKKEKREHRIRRSIMKVAKNLFSSKGYKNTTVDEITDKALIAKATLYQYFDSKENLFLETLKDSEAMILQIIEEKVLNNAELDKKQRLKAWFFYLLSYFEKDSYVIHLIFYRENYFEEKVLNFIKEFITNLVKYAIKVLEHYELEEDDARNLAVSMIGGTYVHLIFWYINGQKENLKDLSKVLYQQYYPYIADKIHKKNKQA